MFQIDSLTINFIRFSLRQLSNYHSSLDSHSPSSNLTAGIKLNAFLKKFKSVENYSSYRVPKKENGTHIFVYLSFFT